MKLTAPVTDYIRASVLTTHGDIVERGAADPERLAAAAEDLYFKAQGAGATPIYEALHLIDTGVHQDDNTKSSAGEEVITGVGFQPSVVIFFASDSPSANMNRSWGFGSLAHSGCIRCYDGQSNNGYQASRCIYIRRDVNNHIECYLSAVGADGFTLTWSLTGACTARYIFLALP